MFDAAANRRLTMVVNVLQDRPSSLALVAPALNMQIGTLSRNQNASRSQHFTQGIALYSQRDQMIDSLPSCVRLHSDDIMSFTSRTSASRDRTDSISSPPEHLNQKSNHEPPGWQNLKRLTSQTHRPDLESSMYHGPALELRKAVVKSFVQTHRGLLWLHCPCSMLLHHRYGVTLALEGA